MTSMRGSIRSTQAKIASLLDSLVSNEVFLDEDIEQIRNTSNKLLDNYKSNLLDMQTEFLEILQRMRDGNYSLKELEILMEAEKARGSETLNIAAEVIELINDIFGIIREVALNSRLNENISLPEDAVKNIAKSLDMASLKVSSIGRIASSSNGNVSRAINLAHLERADLEAHPQRGFFSSTLLRMYSNEDLKKQYPRKQETSLSFNTPQDNNNNNSPDQSNQTPKLKMASVRIRAQTSINFESDVSNSPTSPTPQNYSDNINDNYRKLSTTNNMKYMLKSNEYKKGNNNNKEKPDILMTYPNTGGGINSRGSLFATDTNNNTSPQKEGTTQSSKIRLKAKLTTSRVFTVTVKQEISSNNIDTNFSNSFLLPTTTNINKNSISKYSPKIKLTKRASSSSSKKRVIGAKEREKGKSVIDALILSEELKQFDAIRNQQQQQQLDSDYDNDDNDEVDSETDTDVVLPMDATGGGPRNNIKLKPVIAPPSLRDGNYYANAQRRGKPSPHLQVTTDSLSVLSTSYSMSPNTMAVSLPPCLFARSMDLLKIIPLIVSYLPLQLSEVMKTSAETVSSSSTDSVQPGMLLSLEVDGFLPATSTPASSGSTLLNSRRNALQQDPMHSTITSMMGFSSSSKMTLPEVYLPSAFTNSNDTNLTTAAATTTNRPFLSTIAKPKSMNHTNMSNRLNALSSGRSKSTKKIFDDYNSSTSSTSQINIISTSSSASSSQKGGSGNGSYRNANSTKFVETIVIYPVNTVNRETSTIDLEVMTSSTTTTTTSSITMTTTTTRGSLSSNNHHHQLNLTIDSPSGNSTGSTTCPSPSPSPFVLKLSSSENPLLLLYETYKNDLSELAKSRFLSAVSGESNSTNSLPILSKVFTNVTQEMEKLRTAVTSVDCTITSCEESLRGLAPYQENCIRQDDRRLEQREKLLSDTGSVSSSLLLLQLQFSEYRTMFERLIASEASRLPRLLQSCAAFNESYQIFVDCQGKLRTQQGRLLDLKGKCQRIYRQLPQFANNGDGMNNNNNNNSSSNSSSNGIEKLEKEIVILRSEMERNVSYIHQLEEELREAESDFDGLRNDFLDSSFTSSLGVDEDGAARPSLQNFILHIGTFKTLIDGSEIVDFPVLSQRLSLCINYLPSLQQLMTVNLHTVDRLTARKPMSVIPPPRLGLLPNDDLYGGGYGVENYPSLSTAGPGTNTASSSIPEVRAFTARGGTGGGLTGGMKQCGTSSSNNKRGSRISSSQVKGGGRDKDKDFQEDGYAPFFAPTRKPTYNESDFQSSEHKSNTMITSSSVTNKQMNYILPTLQPKSRKSSNVGHNM